MPDVLSGLMLVGPNCLQVLSAVDTMRQRKVRLLGETESALTRAVETEHLFDSFNAFTVTVTPQSVLWKYRIIGGT